MHPEFSKIYSQILNQYRRRDEPYYNDFDLTSRIENIIDETMNDMEFKKYLRPDAKLFLLINIHQLVALPLSFPMSPTEFNDEVENGIRKDVKKIPEASLNELKEERNDVAASHVLWGTAKVLDNLSLKSWRIWEKKSE